jgi:hypothetical protein
MRKRIYISCPITQGHSYFGRNWNLFQASLAQAELIRAGYATYNPALSMAQFEDIHWNDWLEQDESYVSVSDLVLRLPGASLGAERECDFARARQIPVVGPAYFFHCCPCLKVLFPDETEATYNREDQSTLLRFNRAERRAGGLPARAESDRRLIPAIVEGFARAK